MTKINIFGALSILSFVAILFSPADSTIWQWFLLAGILLGVIWWRKK